MLVWSKARWTARLQDVRTFSKSSKCFKISSADDVPDPAANLIVQRDQVHPWLYSPLWCMLNVTVSALVNRCRNLSLTSWSALRTSSISSTGYSLLHGWAWSSANVSSRSLERTDRQLHCESKKQGTTILSITSPNVDRFSNFFHWQIH